MKLDGHARLTNSAIRAFKSQCSKAVDVYFREKVCQLPQFSTFNVDWNHWSNSNETDNLNLVAFIINQEISFLGLGETFHRLDQGFLTREVVAVDLEPLKLRHHFRDSGQKYHFMRRETGATVKQAHKESAEFIKNKATLWIQIMTRVLHFSRRHGRSGNSTVNQRRNAVSHLAVALHSLQDSFSPGHVKRVDYTDPLNPGAIKDIYIYKEQDHDEHGEHDYNSGSAQSVHARSAVYASADLLKLCASSVSEKSYTPIGWQTFQNKWLALSPKAN